MSIFGFIGCGNMGGALCRAVGSTGIKGDRLLLSDHSRNKAEELAAATDGRVSDNLTVASRSNYLFLGVKPQVLPKVLEEIAPTIKARTDVTVVSMAAGVSIETIASFLGEVPIIRIMPNTPVSVGKGTVLYATKNASEAQVSDFLTALQNAGSLLPLEERLIDAGCALSGCGPAFVYMFIEALSDGAVNCGLSRSDALKMAAETVRGAAEMVLKTSEHPGVLKDRVCSPAGSTIAGVEALEKDNFRYAAMHAVGEAFRRTKELG